MHAHFEYIVNSYPNIFFIRSEYKNIQNFLSRQMMMTKATIQSHQRMNQVMKETILKMTS